MWANCGGLEAPQKNLGRRLESVDCSNFSRLGLRSPASSLKLLDAFGEEDFRTDLLKVTHHGSSSGTAKIVVKAIKQGIAIASTAEDGGIAWRKTPSNASADTGNRGGGINLSERVGFKGSFGRPRVWTEYSYVGRRAALRKSPSPSLSIILSISAWGIRAASSSADHVGSSSNSSMGIGLPGNARQRR